jgi:hypothetical protein
MGGRFRKPEERNELGIFPIAAEAIKRNRLRNSARAQIFSAISHFLLDTR